MWSAGDGDVCRLWKRGGNRKIRSEAQTGNWPVFPTTSGIYKPIDGCSYMHVYVFLAGCYVCAGWNPKGKEGTLCVFFQQFELSILGLVEY